MHAQRFYHAIHMMQVRHLPWGGPAVALFGSLHRSRAACSRNPERNVYGSRGQWQQILESVLVRSQGPLGKHSTVPVVGVCSPAPPGQLNGGVNRGLRHSFSPAGSLSMRPLANFFLPSSLRGLAVLQPNRSGRGFVKKINDELKED